MKSLLLAAAALAALSQSALAATPQLSGLLADIFASDDMPDSTAAKSLYNALTFGDKVFTLEQSKLADVTAAYGGTFVALPDDPNPQHGWMCFDGAGTRTWFFSAEVEKTGAPVVNLVVTETLPAKPLDSGCTSGIAIGLTDAGVPGLGATLADLEARFGTAKPDATGHLSYFLDGGDPAVQNLFYLVNDGHVTAVAFSQWSDTP